MRSVFLLTAMVIWFLVRKHNVVGICEGIIPAIKQGMRGTCDNPD